MGQTVNKVFSGIFGRYQDMYNVESISFSPSASIKNTVDKKSVKDMQYMSHIDMLKIIILDEDKFSSTKKKTLKNEIKDYVRIRKLENIMNVLKNGNSTDIYTSEREVFMTIFNKNNITIILMEGDITSNIIEGVLSGKIGMYFGGETKP